MINLTITSCKRPHLLEKTLLSFSKNCLDKQLINKIIWADDNSSLFDHNYILSLIKDLFSVKIIDLYRQDNNKRGLSFSLNSILDNVSSKYIFHIEDDWEFIEPDNYISNGVNFLKNQKNIKQVGYRNWCDFFETQRCHITNLEYTVWEKGVAKNNIYLDHFGFTLNPSIFDVEFYFNKYGYFNTPNTEGSWINSYEEGIRSANFVKNYVIHIGQSYSSFDINQTPR
jgi:hypothetical protein